MSGKKDREKQRKLNSPKRRAKQQKKAYYKSPAAKEAWEEKKARKAQKRFETYGDN